MSEDQLYLDAIEELEEVAKETDADWGEMNKVLQYYSGILSHDYFEELLENADLIRDGYYY